MVDKLIVKKDFLYIRLLFSIPWVYVIFQIYFASTTGHRFEALSKSNVALGIVYVVTFFLLPIFFTKLKAAPKGSSLVISFIILIIVVSLTINNPIFVLKDTGLIIMQVIFFFTGWFFFYIFDSKLYVKKLISDGIIIGFLLGIYATFVDYDLVSPMFGIFALATYARVKFGREFNTYFLVCFLMFNITWSFGKQTILISILSVIVILMSSDPEKLHKFSAKSLYRFSVLVVSTISIFILFTYLNVSDLRSFAKLHLFLDQIKISSFLSGPLTAESIYYGLDVSTAGRIVELLLIWEKLSSSIPSFLFGSGLGASLDLSLKNHFSDMIFTFQETQSVQTLIAFVPSRFGFLGVFLILIVIFKQFKERNYSGNIYVSYMLCLILSFFAFSTVFKFHFISVFLGAMAHNVRIRKQKRVL